MPALLAGIISGPAVLPCSSTGCENAPRRTGGRALLCQGCVCWSWLCISERALTSWENGQIPAELVNKTWREATKFWGEKKTSESAHWASPAAGSQVGQADTAAGGSGPSCRHSSGGRRDLGSWPGKAASKCFSGDLGLPPTAAMALPYFVI